MNTNTAVEPVTETQHIEVQAIAVRQYDVVQFRVVGSIKSGTKWTELRDLEGNLIRRLPSGDIILVERQVETEESKKARTRATMNEMIARKVDSFVPGSAAILEKMQTEVAAGRMISSFDYEKLFSTQADDQIMLQFVHAVKHNLGEVTDHVDILDAFKKDLVKRLAHKAQFITNRSTSACSNLIADHEVAAIASFLDRGAYGF